MTSIFDKYDLVDCESVVESPVVEIGGISLIVGSSGSGKTTALSGFDSVKSACEETPIYKLFSSDESAERYLIASGFRSIPAWKRGLSQVSNGEKQRALMALAMEKSKLSGSVVAVDEFTSLVDRDTARALCVSINKSKSIIGDMVFATCHKDVVNWLNFDYAYDMDVKAEIKRGSVRRDEFIELEIKSCDIKEVWPIFKKHHYLSQSVNKSANCFAAFIGGKLVAMTSVIAFPNANWRDGWRGHRTVVLPEFQGMGIGTAISDAVAEYITWLGCRFFSKTSHPAMGEHRNKSNKWRATSKNMVIRKDYKSGRKTKEDGHKALHAHRVCYSHEFIGE